KNCRAGTEIGCFFGLPAPTTTSVQIVCCIPPARPVYSPQTNKCVNRSFAAGADAPCLRVFFKGGSTMRTVASMLLVLAALFVLVATVPADDKDKKEVTLKGSMVCGKCTLKVCDKCTNVLQVKKDDKTVNYFMDDKGNKEKYHK